MQKLLLYNKSSVIREAHKGTYCGFSMKRVMKVRKWGQERHHTVWFVVFQEKLGKRCCGFFRKKIYKDVVIGKMLHTWLREDSTMAAGQMRKGISNSEKPRRKTEDAGVLFLGV